MNDLQAQGVSLIAITGLTFDLSSATGKLLATLLAGIAEFERDMLVERVRSGLAAAQRRGVKLGRQVGQNPSDKHAARVLNLIAAGHTYRDVAHRLQISPTTVTAIVKRSRG
jgi:putative DNA-invertase from lambdoid prophage Rac